MPEIDESGVDRTQIRRLLALTPAERLAQNDAYMNGMLEIWEGHALRVLTLEALVDIKRRAGRPKDLAAVPYIESTIDEIAKRER